MRPWWVALTLILVALWIWTLPERLARGYAHVSAAWDPPILVQNIITPDECKKIIEMAEPNFVRSTVVAESAVHQSRTSDTAWISKENPIVRKIFEKATELTGKPFENCEDMQVVRYKPGAYYNAHHDSCCEDNNFCREFEEKGGQRIGTLLLYLNDDFTQGQTHFPDLDLKLKATPGSAIFFRPLGSKDNKCHPKALHAGLPINSGTKYVCNIWVREGPFTR